MMKNLDEYVNEAFRLRDDTDVDKRRYMHHPATREHLREIIAERMRVNKREPYLNDIDVSAVKDMHFLFSHHTLLGIEYLDLTDWDVSNVENMTSMFEDTDLKSIDISGWKLNPRLNMTRMFAWCDDLVNVTGINNIDLHNHVCDEMFDDCPKLTDSFRKMMNLAIDGTPHV